MKLDNRKQQVLVAIIKDYIATAEPVGSRTIARKYKLGVSPATIRNEMADLEELGYIEQPHTSAGRIPSNLGYRYYVDNLMQKEELTWEEEELIQKNYRTKVRDVGQVIQRTGQLLANLTKCAAIVMTPQLGVSFFKHIQIIPLSPGQGMVVVVTDTGAVHHRIIEIPESISPADLEVISSVLNRKLQGHTIESIRFTLIREIYFELAKQKVVLDMAMELVRDSLALEKGDKIYLGGIFNILSQPEFSNVEKVKTLLSILEQEDLITNLLAGGMKSSGVTVRIGGELSFEKMRDCSMVMATYQIDGRPVGSIGVLGPTRMNYARVVSVVEYITKNLSQVMERLLLGRDKVGRM